MGLDMYLRAEVYVSGYAHMHDPAERERYDALVQMIGAGKLADPDSPSATVEVTVAYWRKSNQIHQWFVQNVQGGEDECRPHHVSRDQLVELRELCVKLLTVHDKDPGRAGKQAHEELPSQSGFFFGSTEYDEWYWGDLKHTVEMLDRVLEHSTELEDSYGMPSFVYQSSW